MQDRVKEIIKDYPKLFSQIIKRDSELSNIINNCYGITFSEKIYNYLNDVDPICYRGKNRKFKNVNDGYGYCGLSNKCECSKESLALKVKAAKGSYTDDEKKHQSEKRMATNLARYGVTNTGQLDSAKENHAKVYSDQSKVDVITALVKQTKLERHGNENYNNNTQAAITTQERYGVSNTLLLTDSNSNPKLEYLSDKETLIDLYSRMSIQEIANYCDCHIQTVYKWTAEHGLREKYKSEPEREIKIYLESLGVTNIVCNSRSIISSKRELDLYLPDYKLAIEYNGLYWHNDSISHIDRYYHHNKFIDCNESGIHLITLFSNLWDTKKELVKHKIKVKLGLVTDRIYARKCEIKRIPAKDTRDILDTHHIQGYVPASICYGMYYENQLVSCMTFSKPRPGIGKSHSSGKHYELVRYVSSILVVGGASKILARFIDEFSPETIISYSDNNWNTGGMYEKLGFKLDHENKANYWYYHPSKHTLDHRYSFTKYKLVAQGYDANKTEKEIMQDRGFVRVWDCGTRVWKWSIT